MSALEVFVESLGVCGPGLTGWPAASEILAGRVPYVAAQTVLKAPEALPAAERRRVGAAIKLSMAIGYEAARNAEVDPATLPTVFSSTGGDCDNCHALCETLASDDRQVSPTRFHNSVHNAPSGYWSIATGCMEASTSLCAYDGTFSAALLEGAAQAVSAQKPCLLIAYDTHYPEPLNSCRPISDAFGVSVLLTPNRTARTLGSLKVALSASAPTLLADSALEALRKSIPTARGLPLLAAIATKQAQAIVLDYLDDLSLTVEYAP